MALTDRDKAVLDFEQSWWDRPGTKADSIRADLELSDTRYYQLLAEIIADPDAISYDPLLVRRLRRDRDRRRREKLQARPATEWRSR